eukprot:CAMPEP_0185253972 /NCGR_PEP_ID=MMETSP1359-20130426/2591_1 /TAXON_ID=552665 /ORGANISM="Bigelowiella longifila, Strain CCMP242" /LENGTH=145 /DNA_ID=CAMNT_0027836511 /DNA_START=105 /DNA_END=542 /DNA_ORIENTATION=+
MDRLATKLNRGNRLLLYADRRSPYETSDSATPTRRSPYDSQGVATETPKRTAPPKTSPFDSFTPSARDEIVQASRYEGGSSRDPEGFWENTGRYIRYFFSVNFGIIISIVGGIISAVFKNPWVLLVLGGSGAGVYFTVKAMLDVQ